MNIQDEFNKYILTHQNAERSDAFEAGYKLGRDSDDSRDVIIARLSIQNERQLKYIKSLHETSRAYQQALNDASSAVNKFEQLRHLSNF